MDFEKKYWSKKEYKTAAGEKYTGYVGIFDGKVYEYDTEKELFGFDSYIARINCSKENFDRTLSHQLKLPYAKKDVTFAANDFLYGNIVKTAISRLQENNDYIFKNAIISNSILPYSDNCTLLSSLYDKKTGMNSGKLGKFNFAASALATKTSDDPGLYPDTKEFYNYFVKNKLNKKSNKVSDSSIFIDTPSDLRDQTYDYYSSDLTPKEMWAKLYGKPTFDTNGIVSKDEALYSGNTLATTLEKINYTYTGIPGDYIIVDSTSKEYNTTAISFKPTPLINLLKTDLMGNRIYSNAEINLQFNSVAFIIENNPADLIFKIIDTVEGEEKIYQSNSTKFYQISDSLYYTIFTFNTPVPIDRPTIDINIEFNRDVKIAFNNGLKYDASYSLGTIDNISKNYKNIPNINRKVSISYIWKTDDNSEAIIANPKLTYKLLIESDKWKNAKNPHLVYSTEWDTGVVHFIPKDGMLASDVYSYMLKLPANVANKEDYIYPSVYKSIEYIQNDNPDYIISSQYRVQKYPINSYIIEDKKLVRSFKTPEQIYNDIYGENVGLLPYDKIPDVSKTAYIKTVGTENIIHNFNEITASNIIIKSINENIANLLVFLLFKHKLVIFKTTYDIKNDENNFALKPQNDKSFIIDLSRNSKDFIEIKYVNPDDNTSLQFLNLNAIKVYKNMMYLVDSKLDMILRYDIDYLVSDIEGDENSFRIESIKLLDVMQGLGDSTDKIYFNNPYSIDVNDDYVYIVDRNNKCIKSYTPSLNFVKTLKNGFFASQDIQAVAINPHSCIINNVEIGPNSVWIASVVNSRIYISVLEDDIVKAYGQIEDISLLQDEYSWLEEVRGIVFSKTHSNYFYLNTNKRIYKFHVSKPFYPFASLSYFKQRSIVGTMRWAAMHYPWHKIPSIYGVSVDEGDENIKNEVTWDYQPPASSAEVLDNKCFCLTGDPAFNGDLIFHYGVLYDDSMIRNYISEHKHEFDNKMTFYDIELGSLANMIKSDSMLLYKEPASFISTISNPNISIYDIYNIENNIENDYVNSLTFNKMLHSVIFNLLKIKNSLIGKFKAATNIDNVIVYDNLVLDDYFNNLKLNNNEDYFIHDNENLSIIVNRVFENIHDLQEKILNRMQTEFMAAQTYVNNTSRLI